MSAKGHSRRIDTAPAVATCLLRPDSGREDEEPTGWTDWTSAGNGRSV
jgi:hypothetical protein